MKLSAGSLGGALGWWLGALVSVFVGHPDPFARRAVRLRPRDGGFAVIGPDGAVLHELALATPDRQAAKTVRRARARYLDLDDECVLSVTATLPAAAEANLREALGLRMAELTPFTEDEVLFQPGRPVPLGHERISVPVSIAPKSVVAEHLVALERLGIHVDGVVATEGGEATGAMVPEFAPEILRRRGLRLALGLAIACMLLVGSLGWLYWVLVDRQERTLDLLERSVTGLIENVRAANALEREVARLSASLAVPARRRADQVSTLALLDGVAHVLPDDAYLTGFRWAGEEVVLTGLAADASALIRRLDGSPLLSEVRFVAPIAHDPRLGRDRFSISARTSPEASGR